MAEKLKVKTRPCRACGKEILLIRKADGTGWMPLNVRRVACYTVGQDQFVNGEPVVLAHKVESGPFYIQHHNTCTDPGGFTRKRGT